MDDLKTYSGIATKLRAMGFDLFSALDYESISACEDLSELVRHLSGHRGYEQVFALMNREEFSWEILEKALTYAPCLDLNKIYHFADFTQRKFLDTYYILYETRYLKLLFRKLYNETEVMTEMLPIDFFFRDHASLELSRTASSGTIRELIQNLDTTLYYGPLTNISMLSGPTLLDYEMALDTCYFKALWKSIQHFKQRSEREILFITFGKKIDLLNLLWIYRIKKYYPMGPGMIYPYLIPLHYRISSAQLKVLVESVDLEDYFEGLKSTSYGKFFSPDPAASFERTYERILGDLHRREYQKHPYSIASINNYVYRKDRECKRLISMAECIRYNYTSDQIRTVLHQEGGA